MADRVIDPSVFSIPELALELEGHSMRFALASNVYGDNMEFLVRVLTPPMPMGRFGQNDIYRFMRTGRVDEAPDSAAALQNIIDREIKNEIPGTPFSFQGRILGEPGRPSPHSFLPDPCNIDSAQNKLKAAQLITLHTNFRSPAGYTGAVPRMGDIVKISLEPGSQGPFSLQKAFFKTLEKKKDPTAEAISSQESCSSLQGLPWGEAAEAGSSPAASERLTKAEVNATVPRDKMVISQLNPAAKASLTSIVAIEKAYWAGKKEMEAGTLDAPNTTSRIYRQLLAYYAVMLHSHNPAPGKAGVHPAGGYATPISAAEDARTGWVFFPSGESRGEIQSWSAAYISYIMYMTMAAGYPGTANTRWQGSSAHHYYVQSGKTKGWNVYSLSSTAGGKIKANIGDILITIYNRGRAPSRDTPSTHGDVVYKIADSKAYLSGGNVSNTVTTSRTVDLDSTGCYKTDAPSLTAGDYPYYTVMKYNTELVPIPPAGSS